MKRVFYIIAVFAGFTLLTFGRQYIYLGIQHAGLKIGFNFNNISKNSYVQFIKSQTDEFTDSKEVVYLNHKVQFQDIESQLASNFVLGENTQQKKKTIDVNLREQRLYMKEGDTVVGSFLISSGKWAPTPTGSWPIWIKLRYTRMKGGSKTLGTFYDLPNVPYVMYFYKGYGVHGAYWHTNFGHPMSHGCINMKPDEAGVVYNWAEVGTVVTTHY